MKCWPESKPAERLASNSEVWRLSGLLLNRDSSVSMCCKLSGVVVCVVRGFRELNKEDVT